VDHPVSHKGCIFPGGNQYKQFMDCLHGISDKYQDKLFALGISPGDLESHSARKGTSSHAPVAQQSLRQWHPYVFAQCGIWAI
jgi:hypothetical protein